MTPESLPAASGATDAPGSEEPDETAADSPAVRRRRRWWLWGLGAALLVGAVLGALFVPTPYVLLEPGSVRATGDRIQVKGAKAFNDAHDVMFTTVYVDRATLFGLLRGSLDDAVEIHTQDEIYGTRGRDASQKVNQAEMDLSKLVATREALELLGYQANFTGDGARVIGLQEGGAAEGHLREGDVIVAVDGTPVHLPDDLRTAVSTHHPGDEVTVSVTRPGGSSGESAAASTSSKAESRTEEVSMALGTSPDGSGRAVLGVNVQPVAPRVEAPVSVNIDSGTVTGPSAGLAWTLGIIDRLTPGDLSRHGDVAVTGEIHPDGKVGVIGGITQKVATVRRAGVKTFLYPADTPAKEQRAMRRVAGDAVKLVPVHTLAEAVRYLAPQGVAVPGGPTPSPAVQPAQ